MSKNFKLVFMVLLIILIAVSVLLFIFDPQVIVDYIGLHNVYLSLFVISLFSGVSTLTSVPYLATLYALAQTTASPLLLGIAGGLGIFVGDVFYYYLGHSGRQIISGRPKQYVDKFANWLGKRSDKFAEIISYLYTGFTPLPNDILMLAMSLGKVPFNKIAIPVLIGTVQLSILLAYFFSAELFSFLAL